MQIDWMQLLYDIFKIAIIPLLGVGVSYLVYFIKEKVQEIKDKVNNEKVSKYLTILETYIIDAVVTTNQTYVNSLKEKGTFDLEAQKEAFTKTKETVLSLLTDEAKEFLETFVGDLDLYIDNIIEYNVYYHKEIMPESTKKVLNE